MHSSDQFAGETALITGSSGGVGREIALDLARQGANIVVNGRSPESGKEVVEEIESMGQRAHFEQGDITDPEAMETVAENAIAEMGEINILVGSGGVGSSPVPDFFRDQSVGELHDQFETHYMGRLNPIKAILDHMVDIGGGRIVNVSADAGRYPTPGEVGVGGSTAGLMMATRVLATELSRWNITVNTVSISVVQNTPGFERMLEESPAAGVFEKALESQDFEVTMDDVAEAIAFFAADRPITGQILSVNGGIAV